MDELISREAVKEMMKNHRVDFSTEKDYRTARACANAVPSAQPEIIQCKDCKHWMPYEWMFSEVWQSKNIADYPEDEIGCDCSEMAMKANDFCSHGEKREVTT